MNVETKQQTPNPPTVALRVRVCMAERNIRSASELQRKLADEGLDISLQQLLRVIDNKVQALPIALMNALMRVFHCPIEQIITTVH